LDYKTIQIADTTIKIYIKGSFVMSTEKKSTKNGKKEDGTFHSKKIKHDPQAESARAVFGVNQIDSEKRK